MDSHYDVIVVGGRCAGAATAMLLARGGLRVLVIEATQRGTDTLSTHALMRGGVLQLHRWGLLDSVVASGTPAIHATRFSYGDDDQTVEIRPGDGISALRAPRRTVLDALLLDSARAAGAEILSPARVTRLLTDGGTVCGVEGVDARKRRVLPCHGDAHRRRRRARLDGRAGGRREVPPPRLGVGRDHLRIFPRTGARPVPLGVSPGSHRGCGADR